MAVEVDRLVVALEARLDRYETNLRQSEVLTDRRLDQIENRFRRFSSTLRNSASTAALGVGTALGTIGTYLSGRELQQYADAWTTVQRTIEGTEQAFGVRLRSASELNKLAKDARVDLDAYAKL